MRRARRPKPCPRSMSCSSASFSSESWPVFSSTCGGAPRTSRTNSKHRIPTRNPAAAGFFIADLEPLTYGNASVSDVRGSKSQEWNEGMLPSCSPTLGAVSFISIRPLRFIMVIFRNGNPMTQRWKKRPDGSTWGEFGDDDQRGRMNLLTEERRLRALKEVKTGRVFCLCHPLDRPGGNVLNAARLPPVFHPVMRDGLPYFNLAFEKVDPRFTDVGSDEAVMLYTQYSTHWDGFPHKGTQFDADGDGQAEKVFYNGYQIVDGAGRGTQGELGAINLGIANMAESGVQGRGVMIDLRHHFGDKRVEVTYEMLDRVMKEI